MASVRTTITLNEQVAARARALGVNVSAAAREGVEAAVRAAMAREDREAYISVPERPDPFWSSIEAWSDDDPR